MTTRVNARVDSHSYFEDVAVYASTVTSGIEQWTLHSLDPHDSTSPRGEWFRGGFVERSESSLYDSLSRCCMDRN